MAAVHTTAHGLAALLLLGPFLGLQHGLVAQDTRPPAVATLAPALATITTDTGDFAPGHREFSRYTDPWLCLGATWREREVLLSPLEMQAAHERLQQTPERDTLPRAVATIAKACAARFTIAQLGTHDLAGMAQLAWRAQDDALVQAVLTQRLTRASTAAQRDSILQETVQGALDAEPAKVAMAEALVTRIEALGPPGQVAQLTAHAAMLEFWSRTFNTPHMRTEAATVFALGQQLKQNQLSGWVLVKIDEAIAQTMYAGYVDASDSLLGLAAQVQQFYRRPEVQAATRAAKMNSSEIPPVTGPADAVVAHYLYRGWRAPPSGHTPALRADFWFPAQGRDTVQPSPGVVSLIVVFPEVCSHLWAGLEDRCPFIKRVKQWADVYGPHKLAITVVPIIGSQAYGRGPDSAAVLARQVRWFYQDFLHLPVTVAVDTQSIILHLPPPDGRIFRGKTVQPGPEPYGAQRVTLVDASGRLLFDETALERGQEAMLDVLLARVMQRPAAVVPAAPASASVPNPSSPSSH